ncbi:MAG: alpha/beta fold hydrolase [Gemmatimonadetes bacterium]|nr:alpha/beta fold hydrolase [Gemmatimonadota bacterium]
MATLHHETVFSGAAPVQWLYVLHGIFGAGRNWGTVARRLVRARPDWGVLLVDLRQHGDSQGFEPPHTIAAAAADLDALEPSHSPVAVLGHSFGGKVALVRAARPDSGLEQIWCIDSTPDAGPRRGSAWEMLGAVDALPGPFRNRDEAVQSLVAAGTALPVARWMTTNLVSDEGVYRWRLDFGAIRELLEDFFRVDAWHVIEARDGPAIHVVRASESSVITSGAAERLLNAGPRVRLHDVDSGHWVNADNPDALVALLATRLPHADPAGTS